MSKSKEQVDLNAMRHSCEHVLTMAMLRIWGNKVKAAMGPATDEGFYFDFDSEIKMSENDFEQIEKEMGKIIKENLPIVREELTAEEAKKFFNKNIYKGNEYKHEWIDLIKARDEKVSIYWMGETGKDIPQTFVDICAGPHVNSTGQIGAFKLLKIAGAYWHGDEKNPMLQRIYGTCFHTKEELDLYLKRIEEAKKRDHRKLGKELDLFSFHDEGPGFPFWHAKGMVLRGKLMDYWHKIHKKYGYEMILTPLILREELWHQSGHYDHYRENMYFTEIDEQPFAIKPMNCPGSTLIYKSDLRSYRDLPFRWAELGVVHRHERAGVLHGLLRVRCFTQDDAHIYCTPEQMKEELKSVLKLFAEVYDHFGFKYHIELSTRPPKSIGSDEMWEVAEKTMKDILKEKKIEHKVNEGDGAFYGPKFDFHLADCLGRTWQCGTLQLDFSMPERFGLEYIGEDSKVHRPVMLHRVVYGSIERFIGILIEHFGGAFPVWCAPVQVKILTVSDKFKKYAEEVAKELRDKDLRVEIDEMDETLGKKIRNAEMTKVPYMLVIGEKEQTDKTVAVRDYATKKQEVMTLSKFAEKLQKEAAI